LWLSFSHQRFGVYSFTYAVLARGISGVIANLYISPWKIGLIFQKESRENFCLFGIPFQLNSFLALIKDDLFICLPRKSFTACSSGYIGFAQKWAFAPLRVNYG